jgi:hypothetical protein
VRVRDAGRGDAGVRLLFLSGLAFFKIAKLKILNTTQKSPNMEVVEQL